MALSLPFRCRKKNIKPAKPVQCLRRVIDAWRLWWSIAVRNKQFTQLKRLIHTIRAVFKLLACQRLAAILNKQRLSWHSSYCTRISSLHLQQSSYSQAQKHNFQTRLKPLDWEFAGNVLNHPVTERSWWTRGWYKTAWNFAILQNCVVCKWGNMESCELQNKKYYPTVI